MEQQIRIGDWIDVYPVGLAICIGFDGVWIQYRYKAIRESDGATIWVENYEHPTLVNWVRSSDEVSQHVITLRGPYGED